MDINILYGHVEIVSTERREGDDLVLGGYSIQRDREGREVSRTEDRENCRAVDYFKAFGPQPKTWRQRLLGY